MVRRAQDRTGTGGAGAWQWSRTAQTRRTFLAAAREVFAEKGFAEASVAEVVKRSGQSVGSLYHHFGGKTELYLALWEQHQAEHEESAAAAVARVRARAGADRLEQFIAGTRAYLRGSWERRDLARLFVSGDGPPGFEAVRRARGGEWVRQNAVLLDARQEPLDRFMVSVLTVVIGEAAREVAECASEEEAEAVADATAALIRRMDPLSPLG
ncbi:TetR/AcrR family transcriptional regulator [Streptomonospora sp. S1-112]|uniref:TetR/AcrR family transcriptional regulator n=1 Tax=Streptomonospora mangrovi TaxID=2883123 RepID=A0A9X3SEB4_9ACTN|nr:TetR/AcrR family transcriptional regulator [Streptomonospora mangrovi]MDA0564777.1 TetR/AcrR family transcriptional regulator [Streptomonospora mangrovi]